jgi:hypothetical protein
MSWQILRRRIIAVAVFLLCSAVASRAGGPAFVAGSGYNAGVEGQTLIWANGSVQYFTDQGNLSPILTGAQADAMVAAAFSVWTGVSGVALTATQGGHLAEDVNGSNIVVTDGVVTAPADITSAATSTPVGIVYDYDGTVTDALLGEGAGGLEDCFTNSVYGGPDNFSAAGNIVHSLVVINGICAATSAQLPDVQYRLVRSLGRTTGLGWSQANLNVLTDPPATSGDLAGFPVMHFSDPVSCVPITACYPNPAVPKMDDTDALARLYPGSVQTTGRIYGSVYFTDASGNAAQPMQGVNVVARLIDGSGHPSGQYVVTSVSGFLFCGNAGNIIDGYMDANGLPYDRWGSNDPSLEGFFDLGQLAIPAGQSTAQYQLSVEALDPMWSEGVEPYDPTQVAPSGLFTPVLVTVTNGSNAEQDILMLQSEIAQTHPGSGSTYAKPARLPQGGGWGSWISGYGSADWFEFAAQANRTASVAVTALDETGAPTESKLLPVIGIWELSDQSQDPAPASTPSAFNSATFAMSRLDAQFSVPEMYRVGVADFRGDGRPDYHYQASLLYSDTIAPARLSVAGGVATLNGIGFNPGQQVAVCSSISPYGSCLGGNDASMLSASASRIEVAVPAGSQDGIVSTQVTDPASGAFSQMLGALSYGALPTDLLLLLQGAEPATPVGSAAANPIRVRAVAADGVTPVNGATIAWSSVTNGVQFSVCNGGVSCSVLSDEAGESWSWVTPTVAGASTITTALAPASYSPPQSQQATVVGTSSALSLAALTPTHWIAQGATIAVPLTVEALNQNGVPLANVTVDFTVTQGAASLSAASATTNSAGLATVTAQLTNQNASVEVSACEAPNNAPCSSQPFILYATSASFWTLETVSGSSQFVLTGQSFSPLVMRVTDGPSADNPVMGVNLTFATTLARVSSGSGGGGTPVLLGSSQAQVVSDQNGLASIVPSAENVGPCDVFITVSAGSASTQFQMESLAAMVPEQPVTGPAKVPAPQPGRHSVSNSASQTSVPQVPLGTLFVYPEGIPNDDPPPDSQANTGPDLSTDGVSSDREVSGPPVPAVSERPHSPPSESLKPAETKATKNAAQAEIDIAPTNAPSPAEAQPEPAASSRLSDDKRSCRELAGDGPVP